MKRSMPKVTEIRLLLSSVVAFVLLAAVIQSGPVWAQDVPLQMFHLSDVRLLDGLFKNA